MNIEGNAIVDNSDPKSPWMIDFNEYVRCQKEKDYFALIQLAKRNPDYITRMVRTVMESGYFGWMQQISYDFQPNEINWDNASLILINRFKRDAMSLRACIHWCPLVETPRMKTYVRSADYYHYVKQRTLELYATVKCTTNKAKWYRDYDIIFCMDWWCYNKK